MEIRLNCVHEGKTDRIWEFFQGDIKFLENFDEFLEVLRREFLIKLSRRKLRIVFPLKTI